MKQETEILRLYTAAMLAELLGAPVSLIRRWQRMGLLVASQQVGRLSYFDYDEAATARRLVELHRAGCSARTIERKTPSPFAAQYSVTFFFSVIVYSWHS